jgi:hypothetical protein
MLLHGAQNATADLMQRLLDGSTGGPSITSYYLISALIFGVLMTVVALLTRGRLGMAPSRDLSPKDPGVGSDRPSATSPEPRPER